MSAEHGRRMGGAGNQIASRMGRYNSDGGGHTISKIVKFRY